MTVAAPAAHRASCSARSSPPAVPVDRRVRHLPPCVKSIPLGSPSGPTASRTEIAPVLPCRRGPCGVSTGRQSRDMPSRGSWLLPRFLRVAVLWMPMNPAPPAFHNRLSRSRPPGATPAAVLYPMRRRLSSGRERRAPPGCRPRPCFTRSARSPRDAGCGPLGTDHCPWLPWRGDALRQGFACRSQGTHLTLLFVATDANICHGWSPLCGMGRVMACGAWATTCG
jgi:hypothetical protein